MNSLYNLLQQKRNISDFGQSGDPSAQASQSREQQQSAAAEPVLQLSNIPSRWANEIQRIAFFLASQADSSDSTLCVTFAGLRHGTGTTTVSYLVANYLAAEQSHKHVLYIDHAPSNVGDKPSGTGNFISVGGGGIPRLFSGNIPLFNRITIFPDHNVSAPVSSRWFREFMQEARKAYQIIIADTPPFAVEPGSFSLAMATDGVVLVLQAGETRYPAVNTVADDLEDLGIQILGAVLNRRRFPIPRWLIQFI